jgi:hypothetical protein
MTEDRRLVLFVAGCELPEGAQGRAHRLAAATIASGANTEGRRGIVGLGFGRRKPSPSDIEVAMGLKSGSTARPMGPRAYFRLGSTGNH